MKISVRFALSVLVTVLFQWSCSPMPSISRQEKVVNDILKAAGRERDGLESRYVRVEENRIVHLKISFHHEAETTYVHPAITQLKGLRELEIAAYWDSSFTMLPPFLAELPELRNLYIVGAFGFNQWDTGLVFESLEEFAIDRSGIDRVPTFLKNCPNLKKLIIGYSPNLKKLPDWEGFYLGLEEINFGGNGLTSVPAELFNTTAETITLSQNPLSTLPAIARKNTHTKTIFMRYNKFTEIPQVFLQFSALEDVYMGNNEIENFPSNFCDFKNINLAHSFTDEEYEILTKPFDCD